MTKYIFIVGGVISGVGKGVAVASIGKILQMNGYSVTAVKIDPYINYDAGTLRPTEHGEVWVTEDGGETDQDLGNYERFLSLDIPRKNCITTGQIYKEIIEKERRGEYLGQTVQFIPHVLDEIKKRIRHSANGHDIVLVEIGGTVGDYENIPFLLAAKSLEREIGKENVSYVLVTYLPTPFHINESKTKPTQQAIQQLFGLGIFPDFILCRASEPLDDVRKKKIETYVNLESGCVISAPDVIDLYAIPLNFEKENFGDKILKKLHLDKKTEPDWSRWKQLVANIGESGKGLNIAIIGKYLDIGNFQLTDSYLSIKESILHAAAHLNSKANIFWLDSKQFERNGLKFEMLRDYDGVIIPGGFGSSGIEGKISVIKFCRENNIPFLGLCLGMQLAVVEFARNVCGLDAHSTEINPNAKDPVIDLMPWQTEIIKSSKYGATMRLGAYPAELKPGTRTHMLYSELERFQDAAKNIVSERHRHRYEVNPAYHEILEEKGLVFSGWHVCSYGTKLIEFIELPKHKFFMATQAHPEFKSRFEKPAPLFYGFLKACSEK
jgi:CTP synthase